MLTYEMGNRGGAPKYLYLYQCIRDDILRGKIPADQRLPSKRALADHLGVSVVTVENAYRLLVVEGYVRSQEKVGFFVERIEGRRRPPGHRPTTSLPPMEEEHAYFADFSSNKVQMSLFPASTVTKLTREMLAVRDERFFSTVPYNGTRTLRHAIADYLRRYRGMEVDPDQVIVGCGTEYLYGRLMQLFEPGTVLGLEDPGNHKFADIAARNGLASEFLPVDEKGVRLDALSRSRASLVHVSPANSFPLGSVMPIGRRLDLLSWLYEDSGRYLVEDDFDSEVNSFGNTTTPIFQSDFGGRTVYLNSFSKTLVPSLRISYMVLPTKLVARYRRTQTFFSWTVSGSDQYVLARFLADGHFERHLSHLNAFFRRERAQVLSEMSGLGLDRMGEVVVPEAGTHVILRLGEGDVTREQMRVNARSLDIRFAFVSDYAAHPWGRMGRDLIVNYASVPPERLHEGLSRLMLCLSRQSVGVLP